MPIDRNNGTLLTLGVAGALAIVGAVIKRGSRSSDPAAYETVWLDADDYTTANWICVQAVRRGSNVLKLFHREDGEGISLAGGDEAHYELVYEWLSRPQASLSSVKGSESSYWNESELNPESDLFDQVDLF